MKTNIFVDGKQKKSEKSRTKTNIVISTTHRRKIECDARSCAQNTLKYKEAQMQLKQLDPSVAAHWETINNMFNQHIVNTPNVFNDPSGSFEQPMYQPPKEPNPLV